MTGVRVIAHRGSSALHADNSWAAFKAAVADGADAIECDVQASRDGALVVCHDLTLGDAPIAELSAAEIAARSPGMPLLADVLAFASRAPIDLLVEVKDPGAAVAIARMVEASGWSANCVLGGFHGPALAAARLAAPGLRTSFMMGSVAGATELIRLAQACHAGGLHLCWEARAPQPHTLLGDDLIGRLRSAGLAITLWHEEREAELRALLALEPDAICTNMPALLRRLVDAASGRGSAGRLDTAAREAQEST